MTQRTKFKIVVYVLLFIIACLVLAWFGIKIAQKSRDYQRLGDLKVIQSSLSSYYLKYNTYKVPGCNDNSLLSNCVAKGEVDFSGLKDPKNNGIYRYVIYNLSDSDYQIGFSLESKTASVEPGGHIYGKNGLVE